MNSRLFTILFVLFSLSVFKAIGSHIVGGEVTYVYLGDSSTVSGTIYHKYKVSLSIYEDCLNGQPEAIQQDNPAFIGIFDAVTTNPYIIDTSVYYLSSVPVPINFSNSCVSNIPSTCLLKKTFIRVFAVPSSTHGYIVAYERCCRNASILNVNSPGDEGSTYYCYIPPTNIHNNSAVFKNYPPQIICLNNPLYYDNSATDADGDSLSYGFCAALKGANDADIKPIPYYPNFADTVVYIPPYSAQTPMTGFPPIQINPVTGLITGTPNRIGRFLVTVYCNEYRSGVLINTIKREFQFVVTDCSKVVIADIPQYSTDFNTYIVDCADYTIHFVNTSSGGFAYHWDFGVAGTTADVSEDFEPTFTYPDTGTFTVKLVVNPGSTCPDSINRLVKVYPKFYAAFVDSGKQCPGAPISFIDQSTATIKPITNWQWNFGDGGSSSDQNPVHSFSYGGTFNVTLISKNIKNCIDTAIRQVTIETFKPFAGNDTIIVKGENILFDAQGGIQYSWSPPANLNDTSIYDPLGAYPDTGQFVYMVHVISKFGCTGDDTIKVTVVGHSEFVVPTGFTPNGDGLNDYFKPIAIGYRSLKYFRVFDRWGERVFNTTSLEEGWDGTFNNKKCDMGTYFWEIGFTDRFGKDGFQKGDVTLIR
jgi:gliding motility-associated-like protein